MNDFHPDIDGCQLRDVVWPKLSLQTDKLTIYDRKLPETAKLIKRRNQNYLKDFAAMTS